MTRRDLTVLILVNGVLLLCAPWWVSLVPSAARVVGVMGGLCLAPGLAWDWIWPSRRPVLGATLARSLVVSTLWLVGILVGFRLAGQVPTQGGMWAALVVISNVGVVAASRWRRPVLGPIPMSSTDGRLAAALFVAGLLGFTIMATRVVPPMPDHDLEVQATGYALLSRLEPKAATDRGLSYYFAHPPLLHVFVAGSFLLQGEVEALKAYDRLTESASGPGDVETLAAMDAQFLRAPHLLETRTPNIFLSALTLTLLGVWARRRSRRGWVGWWVPIVYASNPEVLVRSSYGGYFSATVLVALVLLIIESRHDPTRLRRQGGLSGVAALAAWGALVNHKLVVVPAGMVLGRLMGDRDWRVVVRTFWPVLGGFLLGTLAFWTYGLAISPDDFLTDHLQYHLWGRVVHDRSLGYDGYPSVVQLWRQFLSHTGLFLVPVALAAGLADVWSGSERHRRLVYMVFGWILVAGVVFSVVDWRMTKHLAPLVVGFHLLLVPGRNAPRWRSVGTALTLAWLLAWNVRADLGLVRDFSGFLMLPAW